MVLKSKEFKQVEELDFYLRSRGFKTQIQEKVSFWKKVKTWELSIIGVGGK